MNVEHSHSADPVQGELFHSLSAMICEGCGKSFEPSRLDQRCCSAVCRAKAHRQRSKTRAFSAAIPSPTKNVRAAPASAGDDENRVSKAVPHSLKPCSRHGYPFGLFEGIDADGFPIFFEAHGDRLLRVWGQSSLSAVELRTVKLEVTELEFPGGRFYRRVQR
ncbi:MAG: hypothetical protein EOQ86_19695 [Mesorhizobium sp.]|uniref:hypothetical protein n=1 Tax=Mesorhizobium sp. TaxID=1871066 RepID=UPI000FE9B461|nr:hypothetical protein [Mesorhizobium sp.]RWH76854.1 MAG: hypothetical protein EOQ85_20165 [Mesorhizobium sp.]RWH80163.1 MAG: hypothetical protein EOQ86_19695 [Mesorhizobium sp.]RWH88758.1 MAG: hypothetical protein EOQ87_20385 [Mesorhizobium sp.]RWH95615.1 MAG: hypothetical protein EOQ88_22515 [Mesorhizobium sp.]RWI01300.1 MAG: hypothetical protein EOQ89_16725 [Mesorhizobium sp.]